MSACRSCGAPIIWGYLAAPTPVPLDAQPMVGGNVRLGRGKFAYVLTAEEIAIARRKGEKLYVSHFSTCPDVSEWRRRR